MVDPSNMAAMNLPLKELFALWSARSNLYGKVLFAGALAHEHGKWKNILTYLLPLHRSEVRESDLEADYGHFKLAKGLLALEEAKDLLVKLMEQGELCLPKLPKVSLEGSLFPHPKRFCGSEERTFPLYWPCYEYRFSAVDTCRVMPPQGVLCKVDLPVYPNAQAAIKDLLYARLSNPGTPTCEIAVLAPDYRARIQELRLSTRGVQVEVECSMAEQEGDLLGKVYYETHYGVVSSGDLVFEQGRATFEAKDSPRHLYLGVLSKSQRDLIDERNFYAGSAYFPAGVLFETTEQDIERVLLAGETDGIEFKKELPAKREDLAIAIASFANQQGGRVLIGVDDNAQVVGCVIEKPADVVANILRSYCEPDVEVKVEDVTIQQKRVIVLTVPEGKDKPYTIKDRGIYVRSGSTNRQVTRYELDEIYRGRSPSSDLFPRWPPGC